MTDEKWRPVVGFEGSHEVSNLGRLRSLDRIVETSNGPRRFKGRLLSTTLAPYEQATVTIANKTYCIRVHVAVATAFLGPRSEGMEVCHNDGDRSNNHLGNLRYDTHTENVRDVSRHGRHWLGSRTHCAEGHEFTDENTLVRESGARRCLTCKRIRQRRYDSNHRARKVAA